MSKAGNGGRATGAIGLEMQPDRIRHTRDSAGRIHVELQNKPENLVLLDSHPEVIEPALSRGRWLVLVYSLLNSSDLRQANDCRELATRLEGVCKVAIRPTMDFTETTKWLPGIDDEIEGRHGLWFLLQDGVVIRVDAGYKTDDELIEFAGE